MSTVVKSIIGVKLQCRSNHQRVRGHSTRDEVPLGGLSTRHGGPSYRVVPDELKPQYVSPSECDPLISLQLHLVESQLRRMKIRLTNQRVVTTHIIHRNDVTLMT